MKKISITIGLLITVAALALTAFLLVLTSYKKTCPEESSADSEQWSIYRNSYYDYSVNIPPGWIVDQSLDEASSISIYREKGISSYGLGIYVYQNEKHETAEQYVARQEAEVFQEHGIVPRYKDRKKVTLPNGYEAVLTEDNYEIAGGSDNYIIATADHIFELSLESPNMPSENPLNPEENYPTGLEIINSFKIKERDALY